MLRRPLLALPLSLSLFAVLSCGEDTSPTQPGAPMDGGVAASLVAAASNTWTARAAGTSPPFSGIAAGVAPNSAGQSIFYTIGGLGDEGASEFPIQAYNVATNTWTTKTSRFDFFEVNGVGKIGNKLYISGGRAYDGTGDVPSVFGTWAYDYTNDQLTRVADMPKATSQGVTGVIDGKLYVLPGICDGTGYPFPGYCAQPAIRLIYRYDPVKNKWGARRACPHYHRFAAGAAINGKFYVAGGVLPNGTATGALDAYDAATDSWRTLAPIPTAGRAVGAALGLKLYVVTADRQTYVYDPATNVWTTKASSPNVPQAAARVLVDGHTRLLTVDGGHNAELYTP